MLDELICIFIYFFQKMSDNKKAGPKTATKPKRSSAGSAVGRPKSRRSLGLREEEILNILNDSGSDDDSENEIGDEHDVVDFINLRKNARQLRNRTVTEMEDELMHEYDSYDGNDI